MVRYGGSPPFTFNLEALGDCEYSQGPGRPTSKSKMQESYSYDPFDVVTHNYAKYKKKEWLESMDKQTIKAVLDSGTLSSKGTVTIPKAKVEEWQGVIDSDEIEYQLESTNLLPEEDGRPEWKEELVDIEEMGYSIAANNSIPLLFTGKLLHKATRGNESIEVYMSQSTYNTIIVHRDGKNTHAFTIDSRNKREEQSREVIECLYDDSIIELLHSWHVFATKELQ